MSQKDRQEEVTKIVEKAYGVVGIRRKYKIAIAVSVVLAVVAIGYIFWSYHLNSRIKGTEFTLKEKEAGRWLIFGPFDPGPREAPKKGEQAGPPLKDWPNHSK